MESKLGSIDTKVVTWHEENNKKFNSIKDQLNQIFKYIEEDKQQKELQLENRVQDVRNLETKIFERFDQEIQSWRDSERKLFAMIEERTNGLWNELSKESKTRFDSIENLKQCLENDFPRL